MLRTAVAIVLALVATIAAASAAVAVSAHHAGEQTLGVVMTQQGSRIERLDDYSPDRLIAVRVAAMRAQGVTLVGTAPDGSSLRVPLVRQPDGRFGTELRLAMPGVWSLALSSQVGAAQSASETFAITVVQGTSQRVLGVVLGLAFALLAGGLGLIAIGLGRAFRRPVALPG